MCCFLRFSPGRCWMSVPCYRVSFPKQHLCPAKYLCCLSRLAESQNVAILFLTSEGLRTLPGLHSIHFPLADRLLHVPQDSAKVPHPWPCEIGTLLRDHHDTLCPSPCGMWNTVLSGTHFSAICFNGPWAAGAKSPSTFHPHSGEEDIFNIWFLEFWTIGTP